MSTVKRLVLYALAAFGLSGLLFAGAWKVFGLVSERLDSYAARGLPPVYDVVKMRFWKDGIEVNITEQGAER